VRGSIAADRSDRPALYEFRQHHSLLRDDKDVIRDFLKSGAGACRTLDESRAKENPARSAACSSNVDALTKEASQLMASIRSGVGDSSQLRATLANVEALTGAVKRDIDPLLTKAKKALDGVTNLTSVIGPASADKLVKALDELTTVANKVQLVATDAQVVMNDIRHGRGNRRRAARRSADLRRPERADARTSSENPWKFFWKE